MWKSLYFHIDFYMSRINSVKDKNNVLYTVFTDLTACVGDTESKLPQTALLQQPPAKISIEIPQTINYNNNEYKITKIYKNAFYKCPIKKIVLPSTIYSIEEHSIDLCYIDEDIKLPDDLEFIYNYALSNSKY